MGETRSEIIRLLRSTKREGIIKLIAWMEIYGFFKAPCSGGNHLAKEGGLAEHSLNVFDVMDDKQAIQILYHCLSVVKNSNNISEELKEELLTEKNIEVARRFHRADECNKV